MTKEKDFKKRVRERMSRTGESYTTARRNLNNVPHGATPDEGTESEESKMERSSQDTNKSYAAHRAAYREESLRSWRRVGKQFCNDRDEAKWTSPDEIVEVLNLVAKEAPQNHVHFPTGGGLDLDSARLSVEPGCIELKCNGQPHVLRPKHLHLVRPASDPLGEWMYFWLQGDELAASGVYGDHVLQGYEEVLEINPGCYVDRAHADAGHYGYDDAGRDLPLPRGARVVTRTLTGACLIVSKSSTFNAVARYDGSHDKVGEKNFRSAISEMLKRAHARGSYGVDPRG